MGDDALIIAGATLLLVGILGGGFELKELKVPTVSKLVRCTSLVAGLLLTLMGIGLHESGSGSGSHESGSTAALVDPPPQPPAPIDPRSDIIAAIRYADDIEAQARAVLDTSILAKAFT